MQYQSANRPPNFDLNVAEVLDQQRFIAAVINSGPEAPDPPNQQGGTYIAR